MRISEILSVHKKDTGTSINFFDRPMLGFWDSKKVGGVPNKFPLVIIATIEKFDVSWILIDGRNYCDIMYSELFKKMVLDKGSL